MPLVVICGGSIFVPIGSAYCLGVVFLYVQSWYVLCLAEVQDPQLFGKDSIKSIYGSHVVHRAGGVGGTAVPHGYYFFSSGVEFFQLVVSLIRASTRILS